MSSLCAGRMPRPAVQATRRLAPMNGSRTFAGSLRSNAESAQTRHSFLSPMRSSNGTYGVTLPHEPAPMISSWESTRSFPTRRADFSPPTSTVSTGASTRLRICKPATSRRFPQLWNDRAPVRVVTSGSSSPRTSRHARHDNLAPPSSRRRWNGDRRSASLRTIAFSPIKIRRPPAVLGI
jgi:hypothetical protein